MFQFSLLRGGFILRACRTFDPSLLNISNVVRNVSEQPLKIWGFRLRGMPVSFVA